MKRKMKMSTLRYVKIKKKSEELANIAEEQQKKKKKNFNNYGNDDGMELEGPNSDFCNPIV